MSFAPTAQTLALGEALFVRPDLSPKNFMDYGGTLKDGTNP